MRNYQVGVDEEELKCSSRFHFAFARLLLCTKLGWLNFKNRPSSNTLASLGRQPKPISLTGAAQSYPTFPTPMQQHQHRLSCIWWGSCNTGGHSPPCPGGKSSLCNVTSQTCAWQARGHVVSCQRIWPRKGDRIRQVPLQVFLPAPLTSVLSHHAWQNVALALPAQRCNRIVPQISLIFMGLKFG